MGRPSGPHQPSNLKYGNYLSITCTICRPLPINYAPTDAHIVRRYVQAEDPDIPWDPPAKEKELFHKLSRFILLYNSAEELEAFCMFRFEADKNYEGKMQFMVYM